MTVAERDVEQALERANILQIASGCTVRAAVVGETVTEAVRQRAEDDGVEVFTLEMAWQQQDVADSLEWERDCGRQKAGGQSTPGREP